MLWKNSNFLYLFLSRTCVFFSSGMIFLLFVTTLEQLGANSIQLSVLFIASSIPALFFSIPAGAYVENSYLQKTIIQSDVIRAGLIGSFALLILFIKIAPILLYIFMFALTTMHLFYLPAHASLLRKIIDKDVLSKANSILNITNTASKLCSMLVTAWLIKFGTPISLILIIILVLYICSIVCITRIRPFVKNAIGNKKNFSQIKEGLIFIKEDKLLKKIFFIYTSAWMIGASIDLYLVSYLVDVLNRGSEDLYLISIFSISGIVVGSLIAPTLYKKIDRKIGFIFSSSIFGVTMLLFGFMLPLWVLLTALFIGGTSQGIFLTFMITFLQDHVKEDYYARVYSFYHLLMVGASLPGYFLFGYIIELYGHRLTGFGIGIYLIFIGFLTILILPSLKREREDICFQESIENG